MKPRLGVVSYLNTRPLVFALERDPAPFALSYSVPSRCAVDLTAGTVDVGLIPSIEYARSADPYYIVPDVAIGTRGLVLTVRLYFRGDLNRIERVALDLSSRTSVALVRILLREKFGLDPHFVDAEPDLDAMLATADAALLIGDPVFAVPDKACASLDLGADWVELTGLPFVFAFWAGRREALSPQQVQILVAAKEEGLDHIEEIALAYSKECGGDPVLYECYLRRHIDFDLDAAALDGLRAFYAKACAHGLIAAVPELRFYAREDGV
jgi:chorismate dehydratase